MAITAAQIIARVRAEGIQTFQQDMNKAGKSVDSVQSRIHHATRVISSFLLMAGAGLAAGLLKLGIDAVEAAAKFEMFRVTLETLTGSAERTKAKLDFIKQLAIPSTFTFSQLAEAGTQLEAFRVPLEKALPLIAKLGAAFPNKEVGDFVNLFGRLASGDFPDLEALSGAGLSKLDFMKHGIKFDSQGSLLSSTRTTMDALEAIINERYGKILDKVAGTTTAKLATVRDKWEEVLRKIGEALAKYVNPALDKLSAWLDRMGKDHNFESFLKRIGENMVKLVGVMFGILAVFMLVVAAIKFAFKDFLGGTLALMAGVAALFGGQFATHKLKDFLKGLNMGGDSGAGSGSVPVAPPGMEYPDDPALKGINDTADNTRRTAEATEKIANIGRHALGGGNLGAIGVTPVEFGNHRAARQPIRVEGTGALASWVENLARQVVNQMRLDEARVGRR